MIATAESEPAASRPETAASAPVVPVVVIEVVREDGRPIAQAAIEAPLGQETLRATTDAAGRAELAAHPGVVARVEVSGAAFCSVERELALDSGTRRVVIATQAIVKGRVTVAGRVPDEPIMITLYDQVTWDHGGAGRAVLTDEAGGFEFFNLRPDWKGALRIPYGYLFSDQNAVPTAQTTRVFDDQDEFRDRRLDAPNPALELRLNEIAAIKGRIVSHATRGGVPGSIIAKFQSGSETSSSQFMADLEGRFRIYPDPGLEHVTLEISDARLLATRTVEIPAPFDQVRNLGDVELDTVHQIAFRVHDTEGHPIAGAIGKISDTWSVSEPTDAEGNAVIVTDQGTRQLRVGKLGYAIAIVPVSDGSTTPLDVELHTGNQLVIDVRLVDGSIPRAGVVDLDLSSDDRLFVDGFHDLLFQRTGASESFSESSGANGSTSIRFAVGATGRIVAAGFNPGAQVAIKLLAHQLGEVLDESFVTMGAADTKTITLYTQTMPRDFVGVVKTVSHDPIGGADVRFVGDNPEYEGSARTDREGHFTINGIFTPSVRSASIWATGFVSLRMKDLAVPPPGAEPELILHAAHDVTIFLVDEAGRRILDKAEVVVRVPGAADDDQPGEAEDLGDGSWLCRGLPPGPIEISASVGVAHVGIQHDSRVHSAQLIIPSEGGAEIHWRRDDHDPIHCRILVESVPPGALRFTGEVPAEVTDHAIEAKLPPGTYRATVEGLDSTERWVPLASSGVFKIEMRTGILVEIPR